MGAANEIPFTRRERDLVVAMADSVATVDPVWLVGEGPVPMDEIMELRDKLAQWEVPA